MNIHELILDVQALLGRTMKSARSPEEKDLFGVAAAALMFISETGAVHPFEDYLKFRRGAAPYVVAAFKTHQEADTWLRGHPEPPHGAFVLVADEYYIVMYERELNHRHLFPHPILAGYLEQIQRGAPATFMASFDTREEAEAWLKGQSGPPRQAYIMIGERRYVALYHRNLNHYAIYLLPPATRMESE